MKKENDSTLKMTTLSEQINEATKIGYTEDFKVEGTGIVSKDGKLFTSDKVKIVDFYRFEGYSDPNDSSILYLIETIDGIKGKIIDAYGADADQRTSEFIGEIEKIQKK